MFLRTVFGLVLLVSALLPGKGWGQDDAHLRATEFMEVGRLSEAEAILDSILFVAPSDVEARLARGNVRAWRGSYAAAREDFGSALATRPGTFAAYLGMGYSFAWEGNYSNAVGAFNAALQVEPQSLDAEKGLAYVALWSGNTERALSDFRALNALHPDEPELLVGLGQALVAAGRSVEAHDAFQNAYDADPSREDAQIGLQATRFAPPKLEITGWGGYTAFLADAEGETSGKFGLRYAGIAYQMSPSLRIWGQYDDGLGLDNRTLLSGQTFPAYTLGLFYTWSGKASTKLQGGYRSALSVGQFIASVDQVFFLSGPVALKVVGFVGPREDQTTEMYGGGGLTIGLGSWWIEGLALITDTGIDPAQSVDDPQGFELIGAVGTRLTSGIEFTGGVAGGRLGFGGGAVNRMAEVYLKASAPLASSHRVFGLIRHHRVRGPNDFTQLAVGLSIAAIR